MAPIFVEAPSSDPALAAHVIPTLNPTKNNSCKTPTAESLSNSVSSAISALHHASLTLITDTTLVGIKASLTTQQLKCFAEFMNAFVEALQLRKTQYPEAPR